MPCGSDGIVVILLVFLLPIFITLCALVADYGIAASGGEQHQNIASAGAVAALETWLRQYVPANNNQDAARDSALARSVAITGLNVTLSMKVASSLQQSMNLGDIGLPGSGASNGAIRFGRWWFACPTSGCVDNCMNTTTCLEGSLPPTSQCFQELNPADPCDLGGGTLNQADYINSVRLELKYTPGGLSPAIFSKLWGFLGFTSNVVATAATVPIHVVLVGDVSDSMREETHLMRRPPTLPPTNAPPYTDPYVPLQLPGVTVPFTMMLTGQDAVTCNAVGGPCSTFVPAVDTCRCQCNQPCPPGNTCAWGLAVAQDRTSFYGNPPQAAELAPPASRNAPPPAAPVIRQGLYDARAAWPGTPPLTRHFKSDYSCVSVSYSENRNDGLGVQNYNEDYLIDTFQNVTPADGLGRASPNFYGSAEPFGTVLSVTHIAAQTLNQRNVAGNLIGAVFFDQFIMESPSGSRKRMFPLTSPDQSNTEFQQLLDATNVDNNAFGPPTNLALTYPNNIAQFAMFPRTILPVTGTALSERAYTNIPLALETALNMLLTAPNSNISHNAVVLITDSIETCVNNPSPGTWPPNISAPFPAPPFCADFENNIGERPWHPSFWHDLREDVIPQFWRAQVPIHLFSAGEHIGPNTLNVLKEGFTAASPPNPADLLTESEARSKDRSLIYQGWPALNRAPPLNTTRVQYDLRSAEWPLFEPTFYMYHAVRWTNGGFFPIRRIDPGAGLGNPAVNAGFDPFGNLLPIFQIPFGATAAEASNSFQAWARQGANGYQQNPLSCAAPPCPPSPFRFNVPPLPQYLGVIQRFDPQGRSVYIQIQQAMSQIFGTPSISLVSPPEP